jgi:RNase P subunit RPR2
MTSEQADSALENNMEDSSKEIDAATESNSEEKILFWCPECGQKYRLPKDSAGETGICFKCQAYLFIPSKSQEKPPPTKVILFACKHCGSKQRKARKLIGSEEKCSECGEKNIVPEKSKTSALPKDGNLPEEKILFWCHYCGQKYRLPQHLAGKPGNCDRCHNDFVIPNKAESKPIVKETIIFPCEHCGQKQWKPVKLIGEETKCAKCGGENTVPEESKTSPFSKPETENKSRIFCWCSHCGQKYRLPYSMAGKTANCDKCENDFVIPMESQHKPTRKEMVIFPCEHCGKRIQKTKDLVDSEVKCRECGRGNIVPKKSKTSLFDLVSSKKSFSPAIAIEATRMNLKLPQQMTKPSISEEEEPVEINIPQKKKFRLRNILKR